MEKTSLVLLLLRLFFLFLCQSLHLLGDPLRQCFSFLLSNRTLLCRHGLRRSFNSTYTFSKGPNTLKLPYRLNGPVKVSLCSYVGSNGPHFPPSFTPPPLFMTCTEKTLRLDSSPLLTPLTLLHLKGFCSHHPGSHH